MPSEEIMRMYGSRRFDTPKPTVPESDLPDFLEHDMEGVKRFQGQPPEFKFVRAAGRVALRGARKGWPSGPPFTGDTIRKSDGTHDRRVMRRR